MTVITRFAPSPTGYLHIGSARTALFNWLFAKHHGGQFLLRIEDTDRKRSTDDAIAAIHSGLSWLGLNPDQPAFYQFERAPRHQEIAKQLVASGKAYYCYLSPEELEQIRADQQRAKSGNGENATPTESGISHRKYRDVAEKDAPNDIAPVIRIKAPLTGSITLNDTIQGTVTVEAAQLDDFVILRSDGTPTYMLAVVVDDHDMNISHIIRGDDHLTNSFRQKVLYDALDWTMPALAHIPLIHGSDGAKLSKRHGALGVDAYKEIGILPEAMNNYLLRLGWSHGDEEIIPLDKAIEWFDLDKVGKSPARFDMKKLEHVNSHYMREYDPIRLVHLITPIIEQRLQITLDATAMKRLEAAMPELTKRAKNLVELTDSALFLANQTPLPLTDKAASILKEQQALLAPVIQILGARTDWRKDALHDAIKQWAEAQQLGLGQVAGLLRACLTYSHASPSVFDLMELFGKEETLARLRAGAALI